MLIRLAKALTKRLVPSTAPHPPVDEDRIPKDLLASIETRGIKDGWYEIVLCEREKGKPSTTMIRDKRLSAYPGATFPVPHSKREYAMAIRDVTVTDDGTPVVGKWSELSEWELPHPR